MNLDDRPRAADSTLEARLRAAGQVLRKGNANQVEAAGRLREILRHADQVTPGPAVDVAPSTTVATLRSGTSVPEACIDTAELADQVIARLNRNVRDERLFLALRDYTIASQACRRAAGSP